MITYILNTLLVTAILFGYYWLLLRNRFFHDFNRFYLLSIPFLSLSLPALRLNLPASWDDRLNQPIRILGIAQGRMEEVFTVYANQPGAIHFSWLLIAKCLFCLVSVTLLVRLILNLRQVLNLRRGVPSVTLQEARIYFVSEKGTPFSFFRSIFWDRQQDMESETGVQMLRHEIFHVRHRHSTDLLIMEILNLVYWFNPFLHLIRRELRVIHEYGADEYASSGNDRLAYACLLLQKASGKHSPVTHPFFKNLIKRRIAMMTKSTNPGKSLFTRMMIIPLLILTIGLFSFRKNHLLSHDKTIRVVVDAGHGGSFSGSRAGDVLEKNINLDIAKKIHELAPEYHVEVVLSRDKDVSPGSNDLRESLDWLATLPEKEKADLFISIHANYTQEANAYTGFEIYIPGVASATHEKSALFGTLMTDAIRPDYTVAGELKQRDQSIRILEKATVPSLLIECGNMNNPADLRYLTDKQSQEKIARDILKGIQQFEKEKNSQVISGNAENRN